MNELTGNKLVEVAERNQWRMGVLNDSNERLTYAERLALVEHAEQKVEKSLSDTVVVSRKPHLKKPVSIILAGSAGERVQSAATTICHAAILSGLHVTQKNDNPVTQGTGFSSSEIWLSPNPIGYTGIGCPDFVVVVSEDGLRELRSHGVFERVDETSTLYIDQSLEWRERPRVVRAIPLRKTFGPPYAAIGALMFVATIHNLIDSPTLQRTVYARLGDQAATLLSKVQGLEKSFPSSEI
jgi:hypothetical protein